AGLRGVMTGAADMFDTQTVEAMAGRLMRVLEAMAADPAAPVRAVEVLDQAERHMILATWNDTAQDRSAPTVPELFAARVAGQPDAVAVASGDGYLTYAALDEAASRLAGSVAASGAGPESLVDVVLERSAELVGALLAVRRTG